MKVLATAYADLGFDVDIGPLFQTPKKSRDRPWKTTSTSSASVRSPAATRPYCRSCVAELSRLGRPDIMVVIGGVIPAQDYAFLEEHGASAVFGPGTVIPQAAEQILVDLRQRLGHT